MRCVTMCHHLDEDWKLDRELAEADDEDEELPDFLGADADDALEVLTDGGDEA